MLAISDCWQRALQSAEILFSPSLRKNSRKSPSLARRGILRKCTMYNPIQPILIFLEIFCTIQSIINSDIFTSAACTRGQTSDKVSLEVEVQAHHSCQIMLLT